MKPVGQLRDPQEKVVILRPLVAYPISACFFECRPANHCEVVHVIVTEQRFGRPSGLELRVVPHTGRIDFIFVRVDYICFRMVLNFFRNVVERVRRQFVVIVQESDKCTRRQLGGRVRCGTDVPILGSERDLDPRVFRKRLEEFDRSRIGARVVGQAEFPVRIDLLTDGIHCQSKPLRVDIENRDEDADDRFERESFDVLGHRGPKSGRDSGLFDVSLMNGSIGEPTIHRSVPEFEPESRKVFVPPVEPCLPTVF